MNSNRPLIVLSTVLLLLFSIATAFADRGIEVVRIKDKSGKLVGFYKESHALVIGLSEYSAGWPGLPGVMMDMMLVQEVLETNGFNVVVKQNLGHADLVKAYEDFINEYGHKPDARLLFYFAGHGHTLKLPDGGDMGYIVAADAPNPRRNKEKFRAKAIDMKSIEAFAERIQAKHALFLFDSAFSGSVFALSQAVPENISGKTGKPVRQFITAGSAEDPAPDFSVFSQQFVAALNGEGDADGDGYITGVELGGFLQATVVESSGGSQHPQYGKIKNPNLDQGDFVFINPALLDTGGESIVSAPSSPEEELSGDAESWLRKGNKFFKKRNYAEAMRWFRKSAEEENPDAQHRVGILYNLGLGIQQDYAEAMKWFRKAAEKGNAYSQKNVGIMYHQGSGVQQDYAEALKWFRKAAENENPDAQYNIGIMYQDGAGVQRDYAEAMKWYRKAAEKGYARAQLNIGIMLHNGQGIPKDPAEAKKWFRKAAENGNKKAKKILAQLER